TIRALVEESCTVAAFLVDDARVTLPRALSALDDSEGRFFALAPASAYPRFAPAPLAERDFEAGPASRSSASRVLLEEIRAAGRGTLLVVGEVYGAGHPAGLVAAMLERFLAARDAGESGVALP